MIPVHCTTREWTGEQTAKPHSKCSSILKSKSCNKQLFLDCVCSTEKNIHRKRTKIATSNPTVHLNWMRKMAKRLVGENPCQTGKKSGMSTKTICSSTVQNMCLHVSSNHEHASLNHEHASSQEERGCLVWLGTVPQF